MMIPGVQARERERGGGRSIYFVSHAKGQRGEAATGYNTTDTRPGHSGHNNYQPHIESSIVIMTCQGRTRGKCNLYSLVFVLMAKVVANSDLDRITSL